MSAASVSTAASEFYILAPEVPVPERTFVLKHDEDTFFTGWGVRTVADH